MVLVLVVDVDVDVEVDVEVDVDVDGFWTASSPGVPVEEEPVGARLLLEARAGSSPVLAASRDRAAH